MNYLDLMEENFEVLISRYIEQNQEQSQPQQQNAENQENKQQNVLSAILMQFQLKDIKVLDFFSSLQYYLTNGREQTRQNALNLVYQVFLKYNSLQVYESDFFPLLEFFLKKIYDVSLILQSIQIVNLMLVRYKNLQKENGFKIQKDEENYNNPQNDEKIFNIIFEHIESEKLEISQYSRLIRVQFYALIYFLIQNYPNLCFQKKETFIQHIIRHTEDEKDPRNIKISFQIILFVLEKFPANLLEEHRETLFDNLECYYPIEMNSQQENKNEEINQEELQNLLSVCLCTKPLLKTTIGLLTEKIASENNYTLLSALKTFQYIFQKYNTSYFSQKELSSIQQNITIINYDTNDKELFSTHIEILSSFIFFLSDKTVHQESFEFQKLELIDRICQYFLQILIQEGISSDDTKKSLQILQNLSQTFIIANKITLPVFLQQMFANFDKEDDYSHKIQWLENLMYYLQSSLQLSQSQYYMPLSLLLSQNKISEIQIFLKKIFDQNKNQAFKILSLKLFMILNEFPLKSQENENQILEQIHIHFKKQVENQPSEDIILDECYLDFCQIFQKTYQNKKIISEPLNNLQQIFISQFENYLESSENLKFSEKIILFALQGLLLPSAKVEDILNYFFQKTNNKFYTEKTEKIYQTILKYIQNDINLQNNKNINLPQIYDYIFQSQIKNKKIELQIETNLKYLNKIQYHLLNKIINNSQIQNQTQDISQPQPQPQGLIEETKKYILQSLKSDSNKFNYIQTFTKTIKNSANLFDNQFQQQILTQLDEIIKKPDIFQKNIHFFNKFSMLYANQFIKSSLDQENLNCFKNLNKQDPSFQFLIGKLLISSPEALKQIENLVNQILHSCLTESQEEINNYLNFFEQLLQELLKKQKKQYLNTSPLTSLNTFLLLIQKGCSKTQQNLQLINQFYPQGQTEFYNNSTIHQKEIQKSKSDQQLQQEQTKILQMIKLITLSYTPLSIQQRHSSIIMPLLLELLKSPLNQQQQTYLVKVLHYWTQNDLSQFDGNHRNLIETVVSFFDNEIKDYDTLLYSLECLSNIIKVPYPLFCEFKKKILEILESFKDHKKRPVRQYAIFIINSIHTMM